MYKLSQTEMNEYGYKWEGMKPLLQEEVNDLIDAGMPLEFIYRLYPDDTEAQLQSAQEIKDHALAGGIFGIEL